MSKQDTTNFKNLGLSGNLEVAGDIEITGEVKSASAEITEINGRTDTVVVIPTLVTADVALSAAQKKAKVVEVTAGDVSHILTLGLAAGQSMVVKNNDAAVVVLVKNVAADTELSIAASGSAFIVAGTSGAMISIS